jgi:glycosyltransferase involved in cell wall biosynthesis
MKTKDVKAVQPKVSVVMITYGHESFIEKAVEGVLMQKCDFEVELIIADDCSPDNTQAIVKNIIKKHPKSCWIKYTRHQKNKGVQSNFLWSLRKSLGKYIAICEGDDYWTDPLKLQKQVNFMDANQDTVLTYHLYKNYDTYGNLISERKTPLPCTLMLRNLIDDMPECGECPNTDRFLLTYFSLKGDFKYLENISHSVRRFHSGGVMSMQSLNVKLQRQVKTWSSVYDAFKDTKLKKQLFEKRNFFIYKNYLFNWDKNKYNLKKIILFPLYVNQLSLYRLLIRKLINKEQYSSDYSISTDQN